jgi:hypothetical protein
MRAKQCLLALQNRVPVLVAFAQVKTELRGGKQQPLQQTARGHAHQSSNCLQVTVPKLSSHHLNSVEELGAALLKACRDEHPNAASYLPSMPELAEWIDMDVRASDGQHAVCSIRGCACFVSIITAHVPSGIELDDSGCLTCAHTNCSCVLARLHACRHAANAQVTCTRQQPGPDGNTKAEGRGRRWQQRR